MKSQLELMEEEANIADELYTKARFTLVSHATINKRKKILKEIYGENFDKAETFPNPESKPIISSVLANWNPKKTDNPLVIEEYRRLERVLGYDRKLFCLDLEGLLVDRGKTLPGIEQAVLQVKKEHGVVVSTAAPEKEAEEILSKTGLKKIMVFGDLAAQKGKRYGPIGRNPN